MGKFRMDRFKIFVGGSSVLFFYFMYKYFSYFMKYGGGRDCSFAGFAVLPAGLSELAIFLSEKIIRKNNKNAYEDLLKKSFFDIIAIVLFIVCLITVNYLFDTVAKSGYNLKHIGYFLLSIVMGPCFILSLYYTYRKK